MGLKESERNEDDFYSKMLLRMLIKRGAAKAWLSLYDDGIQDLNRALTKF
jgi:hypothetical protein